jgi:hypothetical protein
MATLRLPTTIGALSQGRPNSPSALLDARQVADLMASLPAVATRILAAMLEHPRRDGTALADATKPTLIVELGTRSGDPAAVDPGSYETTSQ